MPEELSEELQEAKFRLNTKWIIDGVRKAMRDPEFMKGFYEWHIKTYGEPYVPEPPKEVLYEPIE